MDDRPAFARLVDYFQQPDSSRQPNMGDMPVHVEAHGSWGSTPRLSAAILHSMLACPILFVTAHVPDADFAQDDLETFAGVPVHLFPAKETHLAQDDTTSEIACERLRLCELLLTSSLSNPIIAAPIQALMLPVPHPDYLQTRSLRLEVGRQFPDGPDDLTQWLVENGLNRVDQIDLVGQFAARGGIIDVFAPGQDQPIRVEFFDNDIESLRTFDLDTQRSTQKVGEVTINSCKAPEAASEITSFLEYLPQNTLIVAEEIIEIQEIGRLFRDRLTDVTQAYPVETTLQQFAQRNMLHINRFMSNSCVSQVSLGAQSVQQFENKHAEAFDELTQVAQHNQVLFFCESAAERQRCLEILPQDIPLAPPGAASPGYDPSANDDRFSVQSRNAASRLLCARTEASGVNPPRGVWPKPSPPSNSSTRKCPGD